MRIPDLESRTDFQVVHTDHNEEEVCAAVKKFNEAMPNQGNGKVWLTTKVMGNEHGTELTRKAVDESVAIAAKYGLKWVSLAFHCGFTVKAQPGRKKLTAVSGCRTCSCCTTRRLARRNASRLGRCSSKSATRAFCSRSESPTL